MRFETIEILAAFALIAVSLIAANLTASNGLSYLPFPVLVGSVLAWTVRRPVRYLIPVALIAELFTNLPLGTLTLVVCTPVVLRRIWPRAEADLTFSFALIVALTSLLQLLLILIPDAITSAPRTITEVAQFVPLLPIARTWAAVSSATFVVAVAMNNVLPQQQRGIVSLEGRHVRRA